MDLDFLIFDILFLTLLPRFLFLYVTTCLFLHCSKYLDSLILLFIIPSFFSNFFTILIFRKMNISAYKLYPGCPTLQFHNLLSDFSNPALKCPNNRVKTENNEKEPNHKNYCLRKCRPRKNNLRSEEKDKENLSKGDFPDHFSFIQGPKLQNWTFERSQSKDKEKRINMIAGKELRAPNGKASCIEVSRKEMQEEQKKEMKSKSILRRKVSRKKGENFQQKWQRQKQKKQSSNNKNRESKRKMPYIIETKGTPINYEIDCQRLLGEGTFGQVYQGYHKQTLETFAIKRLVKDPKYKSRQIQLMEIVNNDFVIKIVDMFVETQNLNGQQKQCINIVMPKHDSNFYQYLRLNGYHLSSKMTKIYLFQIFRGLLHLHSRGICHRDLKPHNILVNGNKLIISDLGSAKILKAGESNISYICSRCYRAPELIFGSISYGLSIDIWAVGCIILQILNKGPFFVGKDSLHHLVEIMKVLGTPTKKDIICMNHSTNISSMNLPNLQKRPWKSIFPNCESQLIDLIEKTMQYSPQDRLSAAQILFHPYFDEIRFLKQTKELKQPYSDSLFSFDQLELKYIKKCVL